MNHLLASYHACPMEEPGQGLSGGMNVFLRGLLPDLSRRGISTDVLTRGTGDRLEVTRPFRGVRILHVPCGWTEPPSRESAWSSLPRFVEGARELIARAPEPYGVVSAHYWMSGVAARGIFGRGAGALREPPLVLVYHTVEARKRPGEEGEPPPLSLVRAQEEQALAGEADRVVCFSEYDLAETEKVLRGVRGKGVVIPPGVDDAFRRPPGRVAVRDGLGLPAPAFLFLLAARSDPGKNAARAVAAIRVLREESPEEPPALLIAGQSSPPGGKREEGVVYAGTVPHRGMPGLYAAADAVVCPSTYESFGLVPLEAMAAGTPVIVPSGTYWGGRLRAECPEATYEPEDRGGLPEAMRRLYRDAGARRRVAEAGRRLSAPFTWERCTESWARVLSDAARRGSPR